MQKAHSKKIKFNHEDIKKIRDPHKYGGSDSSESGGDNRSCESGDADDSKDPEDSKDAGDSEDVDDSEDAESESEKSTDVGVSEMWGNNDRKNWSILIPVCRKHKRPARFNCRFCNDTHVCDKPICDLCHSARGVAISQYPLLSLTSNLLCDKHFECQYEIMQGDSTGDSNIYAESDGPIDKIASSIFPAFPGEVDQNPTTPTTPSLPSPSNPSTTLSNSYVASLVDCVSSFREAVHELTYIACIPPFDVEDDSDTGQRPQQVNRSFAAGALGLLVHRRVMHEESLPVVWVKPSFYSKKNVEREMKYTQLCNFILTSPKLKSQREKLATLIGRSLTILPSKKLAVFSQNMRRKLKLGTWKNEGTYNPHMIYGGQLDWLVNLGYSKD